MADQQNLGAEKNDEKKDEKKEQRVPVATKAPADPLTPQVKKRKHPVVLPYIKGVSEQLRIVFRSYEIHTCFKRSYTLHQLLECPKDKKDMKKVVGPVYHIQFEDCDASYI